MKPTTTKLTKVEDVNKDLFDETKRVAWTYWMKAVQEAELLARENLNQGLLTVETFEIPEYTSLCPRSWFPDFASIKIMYIPWKKVVDEVSLKLYINKFRDFRWGHETTVNELLEDIVPLISPKYIMVYGNFSIRGNVKTIPVWDHWDSELSNVEKEQIKILIRPYLKWSFNKVKAKVNMEF